MSEINLDEKNITALVHGAGGFFYFVPAMLAYISMPNMTPQYREQVRRALNFQIFMTIIFAASQVVLTPLGYMFTFSFVGFLPGVVSLANIIISIQAAKTVAGGNTDYSYPISIAFIKPKNFIE